MGTTTRELTLGSCHSRLLTTISQTDGDLHDVGALSKDHDNSIVAEMVAIRDDLAMAKGLGRRKKVRSALR